MVKSLIKLLSDIDSSLLSLAVNNVAIADNSPNTLQELAKAITSRNDAVVGSGQKLFRYWMPASTAGDLPPILRKIYDLAASNGFNFSHVDFILADETIVQSFYEKKEKFEKVGFTEEFLLFHGTDSCNIDPIFKENFCPHILPKNKQKVKAYGSGIYFSSDFLTALGYSPSKTVILSRVLIGSSTTVVKDDFMVFGFYEQFRQQDKHDTTKVDNGIFVVKNPEQVIAYFFSLKRVYCLLHYFEHLIKYISSQYLNFVLGH